MTSMRKALALTLLVAFTLWLWIPSNLSSESAAELFSGNNISKASDSIITNQSKDGASNAVQAETLSLLSELRDSFKSLESSLTEVQTDLRITKEQVATLSADLARKRREVAKEAKRLRDEPAPPAMDNEMAVASEETSELVQKVPLYVITPTYARTTQISEMLRTGQVLKLTKNVKWIIVEDSPENKPNPELITMVDRLGVPYVYLHAQMPEQYKSSSYPPKGVANRNKGVEWLLENAEDNGVFFFADDDNTYDAELFTEIRKTKKVSVFPIGYIGDYFFDAPIVTSGKVTGFHVAWKGNRKFPIDMAQFAVSIMTLKEAFRLTGDVEMPYLVSYEETKFLAKMLVEPKDMEPLADDCTRVMVWHTKTRTPRINAVKMRLNASEFRGTNMVALKKYMDNILETFEKQEKKN